MNESKTSCIYPSQTKGKEQNDFIYMRCGLRRWEKFTKKQFAYPKEVLDLIRSILPKNMKGEIRKDGKNVSLEEFCLVMKFPKI